MLVIRVPPCTQTLTHTCTRPKVYPKDYCLPRYKVARKPSYHCWWVTTHCPSSSGKLSVHPGALLSHTQDIKCLGENGHSHAYSLLSGPHHHILNYEVSMSTQSNEQSDLLLRQANL